MSIAEVIGGRRPGPFRKQCQCVVNILVVWELFC